MLKLNAVSKRIGSFTLGPIDLQIEPGYVYAIVGPNGSGKSTLYRLMMGLIRPDAGSITRFDRALDVDDPEQVQRFCYVPEALSGYPEWTVNDLQELHSRGYPGFDEDVATRMLSAVTSSDRFRELSKGMQRRTMLGLALSTNAELLLLDEPTDGIDPFARRDVLTELTGYLESGERSLVMATHNLDDVRRIADYIVLLNGGRHIGTFTRDELLEGWQRLWLSAEPPATLPGEISRETANGVTLVTRDPDATRAALHAAGITVHQSVPLDAVESVEVSMMAVPEQALPHA